MFHLPKSIRKALTFRSNKQRKEAVSNEAAIQALKDKYEGLISGLKDEFETELAKLTGTGAAVAGATDAAATGATDTGQAGENAGASVTELKAVETAAITQPEIPVDV